MKSPSQFKNFNNKRYIRGIWDTTKQTALAAASRARREGNNARAVQQENGKWAVYHQWRKP